MVWTTEGYQVPHSGDVVGFGIMTSLRMGLARATTVLTTILLWTWLATKVAVTLIGASTVGDDFNQLVERLPKWAEWLFSTPWWVPTILATVLTCFLIWLSWPRSHARED